MTQRRGISLVEVTVSMVIVSILSMGVIQMLGIAAQTRALSSDRIRGQQLANQLLAEIQSVHWADPVAGLTSFGVRSDEYDGVTRLAYNDIDDYHGWEQDPPRDRDGTPLSGFENWQRSVQVTYATVSGSAVATSGTFTRAKMITVTVSKSGRTVATATAVRSVEFDEATTAALPAEGETDFLYGGGGG